MPARSVCLVTLSLSEAGPGRFGRQVSVTDIYHTIPYHTRGLLVARSVKNGSKIKFMSGWWPSKVSVKGLSYRLTFLIDSQKK